MMNGAVTKPTNFSQRAQVSENEIFPYELPYKF